MQSFDFSSSAAPARPSRIFFWSVAIALGLLQMGAHRHDMNPDGISYIEIAANANRFGWHSFVNAYWSPLYPFLLSLAFRVSHSSAYSEFTIVHVLNFFIYLGNVACFEVFLRELNLARSYVQQPPDDYAPLAPRTVHLWGFLFFFWAYQIWLGRSFVNPDLLVAAVIFLATAILLRIYRAPSGWPIWIALGAILGIGYLAKTAMFVISFFFLLAAFFLYSKAHSYRRAIVNVLLSALIFLAVAGPYIAALSASKHRATFGDSGKIAYTEYVDKIPLSTHWQGQPPRFGTPAHATREIFTNPPIYEFAEPVPGSYPPWYDPSYWYDGVTPRFSVAGQLHVLYRSVSAYFKMFSRTGALYFVVGAILLLIRRAGKWAHSPNRFWLVWFPCYAALAMYSLVLVEERYVGAFALVLLVALASRMRLSRTEHSVLFKRAGFAIVAVPALVVLGYAVNDAKQIVAPKPFEQWQVAQTLHSAGIVSGARVAYIGSGLDAYWAHLAGVRIIAEIPNQNIPDFLAADSARKIQALGKFLSLPVSAVITQNPAVAATTPGWTKIPQTSYYIYSPAKSSSPVTSFAHPTEQKP